VNTETKGIDLVLTDRFKFGPGNASISLAGNLNYNMVVGPLQTNSVIDDPANNPSQDDPTKNPANDLSTALFDRQQRSRIEVAQPKDKLNITLGYDLRKFNFLLRTVRFGETQFINAGDPMSQKPDGTYWNDLGFGADQTFSAKWITDLIVTVRPISGLAVSVGANNIFDIYPDRFFIDPRNEASAVYANPIQSATFKSTGGYSAGRDASNRGRFLFSANQFGFNGRFLFARLSVDLAELKRGKK
jgi:iron complex outermembrane receptor protein